MARVLLFGRLADVAGWRERTIEAASLSALRTALATADPGLGEALAGPSVQAAVDKALVRGDAALTPASEVAFLPPMSGG
ncbi:MAG: molybdopterin synthase sulfur carrier subunit [Caulobacter sp.]|nr:molybdopterin synthase sulfur carrier subunit [Caulobacter sp.]